MPGIPDMTQIVKGDVKTELYIYFLKCDAFGNQIWFGSLRVLSFMQIDSLRSRTGMNERIYSEM